MRPRVFLASPFSGDVEKNVAYARECMADSVRRGEAPFVPHLLFTQVLDDTKPEERKEGIQCGLPYLLASTKLVTYEDLGVSYGMLEEIAVADRMGIPVERRRIR